MSRQPAAAPSRTDLGKAKNKRSGLSDKASSKDSALVKKMQSESVIGTPVQTAATKPPPKMKYNREKKKIRKKNKNKKRSKAKGGFGGNPSTSSNDQQPSTEKCDASQPSLEDGYTSSEDEDKATPHAATCSSATKQPDESIGESLYFFAQSTPSANSSKRQTADIEHVTKSQHTKGASLPSETLKSQVREHSTLPECFISEPVMLFIALNFYREDFLALNQKEEARK